MVGLRHFYNRGTSVTACVYGISIQTNNACSNFVFKWIMLYVFYNVPVMLVTCYVHTIASSKGIDVN
jgi:hypothetical protein